MVGRLILLTLLAAAALAEFRWDLPRGFPKPRAVPGNPMTQAKVKLGRYLFYDRRMSGNGTQSCATCHRQELAFTDGKALPVGSTGQPGVDWLDIRLPAGMRGTGETDLLCWVDGRVSNAVRINLWSGD